MAATKMVQQLLYLLSASLLALSQDEQYWISEAQADLRKMLSKKHNTNVAKNVILFLGDGMGISTVTASRIYKGQLMKQTGEEAKLTFEEFPDIGLIKTYNTDRQVADSAGTATAFLSGVKTKYGIIGLSDNAEYRNCSSQAGTEVTSILDWSRQEGKSTGIVTNTRITHATPAAAYAHSASRYWEGDYDLYQYQIDRNCSDIAYQLIMNNSDINVLFGGGRRYFLHINKTDPELNYTHYYQRADIDLIDEWERIMEEKGIPHKYVWNNEGFKEINPAEVDNVLGLFHSSHMDFEYARDHGPNGDPSIAEMTRKAIEILQKNEKGYFLLVEGGRIDHAHHDTRAARALLETVAFDDAVLEAVRMTNESDTLVVVTADHSHVFMMAGYQSRGNNILGATLLIVKYVKSRLRLTGGDIREFETRTLGARQRYIGTGTLMDFSVRGLVDDGIGDDNLPYTTLVYGNGEQRRRNLTGIDTTSFDFKQSSTVPLGSETHGGEDVAVYALGPMSHLFVGTHEQNFIAHAMAYASCVGLNKDHCNSQRQTEEFLNTAYSNRPLISNILIILVITISMKLYY